MQRKEHLAGTQNSDASATNRANSPKPGSRGNQRSTDRGNTTRSTGGKRVTNPNRRGISPG
jgi:hypothetical protein